jgi:hypothetical protein
VDLAINNGLCNAVDFVGFVYLLLCNFMCFDVVGRYVWKIFVQLCYFSFFCDMFYCTTNLCCDYYFW